MADLTDHHRTSKTLYDTLRRVRDYPAKTTDDAEYQIKIARQILEILWQHRKMALTGTPNPSLSEILQIRSGRENL